MLRHGDNERGAVLVLVAVWLPVLLIFFTFVVDVGNWFQHRRHLQLQADAAALAGAGRWRFPLSACDDTAIKFEARKYAGRALDGDEQPFSLQSPTIYNDQVGGTPETKLHSLVNFEPGDPTRFWRQASDSDGPVGPCSSSFIEVKMTEQDLPWLLNLVPPFGLGQKFVPWIDARARVSLQELSSMAGLMPIAVPDPSPKRVGVTFISECDGSVLASGELKKQTGLDSGLTVWMNNGTGLPGDPGPVTVTMPGDGGCTRVGVRVALSYVDSTLSCSSPLVDCFELNTTTRGIVFMRSWPTTPAGTTALPQARSVELVPGPTCADPYYSVWDTLPDGSTSKQCESFGVSATVDWPSRPGNARVVAELQYGNTPRAELSYNAATGKWVTPNNRFFDLTNIQGKRASGQLGVKLFWCTGGGQCNNAFNGGEIVQRHDNALEELAGPIKFAQVFENAVSGANSFQAGTAHDLVVRIALLPSLDVAKSISDPLVVLKVVGATSQTQALNCDTEFQNLYEELAWGCGPRLDDPATPENENSPFEEIYTKNDGSTDCRTINKNTLWSWRVGNTATPHWPCVAISTGAVANQVPRGLNLRIYGAEKPTVCPAAGTDGANNWDNYWNATGLSDTDPRVVHVILAPFGQFSGSGNDETAAVTGFATFYVTGYVGQGSGFDPPCAAQTCGSGPECDDPIPGANPVGVVVGHFIEYRATVNLGTTGGTCGGGLAPCVAVLTD